MAKVCFLLFLLPFISCINTNSEFKFQDSFLVSVGDSICINDKDCFFCISDNNLFYTTMYYSHEKSENKRKVDAVEFIHYSSTLYSFKSQKSSSYVVLWKIEREFTPIFNAYYINEGKLMKIGELGIYMPCDTCDTFDYSIQDIRIFQRDKEIMLSFLKDIYYMDKSTNIWTLYDAGTLKLSFNIVNGSFSNVSDPIFEIGKRQ